MRNFALVLLLFSYTACKKNPVIQAQSIDDLVDPIDGHHITLKVKKNKYPINPDVYGYNTQGSFNKKWAKLDGQFWFEYPEAQALLNQLPNPNGVTRGPSGTRSWGMSIYGRGGGLETNAASFGHDSYPKDNIDESRDVTQDINEGYPNFHQRWNVLAQATSWHTLSYVVNYHLQYSEFDELVFGADPYSGENFQFNIPRVELGNEYNGGHYNSHFPTPINYYSGGYMWDGVNYVLDPTKNFVYGWVDHLSNNHPETQIGLVLPPSQYAFESGPLNNKLQKDSDWVDLIEQEMSPGQQLSGKIDFGVIHVYNQVKECYPTTGGYTPLNNEIINCIVEGQFLNADDPNAVGGVKVDFSYYFDHYYLSHYFNKFNGVAADFELHVTEWALSKPGLGHGDTMMSGAHVFKFMLSLHEANKKYLGKVKATYQKLYGETLNGISQGVLAEARENNIYNNDHVQGSVEFEAFKLFKPVEKGFIVDSEITLDFGLTTEMLNKSLKFTVLEDENGQQYLFYANLTDNDLTINIPETKNNYVTGQWDSRSSGTNRIQVISETSNVLKARSFGRLKLGPYSIAIPNSEPSTL